MKISQLNLSEVHQEFLLSDQVDHLFPFVPFRIDDVSRRTEAKIRSLRACPSIPSSLQLGSLDLSLSDRRLQRQKGYFARSQSQRFVKGTLIENPEVFQESSNSLKNL